jgi:protein-S-isoprenylcysteine O-methyltransferase Ste14
VPGPESKPNDRRDIAGVIAPPPVLYGVALMLAWGLNAFTPVSFTSCCRGLRWLTGFTFVGLGLLISGAVVRAFRRSGTPVSPRRPTTGIVQAGPYRYSRNPDYVGQLMIYLGVTVAAGSWWPVLLLPAVCFAIQYGVVRREERYLEAKFGQEYRAYRARTPRWL